MDLDLRAYFDNVRHHLLLAKVAKRVNDADVMHLLKTILKAPGKKGVPQGGPLAPLLSNVYLNEVDRMLERAKEVTRRGPYTYIEYVRFADDLVVLVDAYRRHDWLLKAVEKRLREEFAKLQVEVNDEKTRTVNLAKGECFGFLGFEFRRVRSLKGVWRAQYTPQLLRPVLLMRPAHRISRPFSRVSAVRDVALHLQGSIKKADGPAAQAQRHVPRLPVAARGAGGGIDQPDSAWLGELLRHRALEPVFRLCPRLGGEEDPTAFDARPETQGLWLGKVE